MDKPPFVKEERLSGKNHPLFLSIGKQTLCKTYMERIIRGIQAVFVRFQCPYTLDISAVW